jgi:nucleoside-diphosphate-sugar epimerase
MQRRVPDTTRIRNLVGWFPCRSIDDIIRDVVAYERQAVDVTAS